MNNPYDHRSTYWPQATILSYRISADLRGPTTNPSRSLVLENEYELNALPVVRFTTLRSNMLAFFSLLGLLVSYVSATALTYKLAPNERECFYTYVDKKDAKIAFYFAVQSGGSFDSTPRCGTTRGYWIKANCGA